MTNPLRSLGDVGQAVWLDFLHRRILESGELARLIHDDGVSGVTSNPAIFQKAIGESNAYDAAVARRLAQGDCEPMALYEHLAIADIQAAADVLAPLWRSLGGRDGFVSLEVSPYLADDAEATLEEARRLWAAVDRPNLMIKVPGTAAGVPAIRALIAEGVNVNVTLLFSIESYLSVAEAFMAGLEDRLAAGRDVAGVHSVASFFVSRIDGVIDKAIDEREKTAPLEEADALRRLRGRVAIANAKVAYRRYEQMIASPRWKVLSTAGAAPQRLLWASTGTKDPAYSDVLYVETLIGPDTVNTLPPATMDAFRDHGVVAATLAADAAGAGDILKEVERLGLDLASVTDFLTRDGVAKFAEAFDHLLGAVAEKRERVLGEALNRQAVFAGAAGPGLDDALTRAAREGWTRRLWAKDASLWTGADEASWLGWLEAGRGTAVDLGLLETFSAEVRSGAFDHALLMGMGGSSLGPEVLARTFGSAPGHPKLLVLDSTDPAQVGRVAALINPARTLFIVASKSGSTLEPDVLHRYFHDLAERALGAAAAGRRFIAITDPGSALEATARSQGFWKIFPGRPDIGGRYSVLSNFGMVPAAVLGLDLRAVFERTAHMVISSAGSAPPRQNPAFVLGALMGASAGVGRDKLTLLVDPPLESLGAWLEQLIAESTGKLGKGLIPIDGEPVKPASAYGADRLFVRLRLAGEAEVALDALADDLASAGHPLATVTLSAREGLFQEFFRWEVATAVVGAVLQINPFDQPDVEASKVKTRALTAAWERDRAFAGETPQAEYGPLRLFTDADNARALSAEAAKGLGACLAAHVARAGEGDYLAILAYLDHSPALLLRLQSLRARLARHTSAATVLQFGPRFLHSTGQAYKGGPPSGVFLQITGGPDRDLAIPGRTATFGVVETAQAQGDFEVLVERGRRALRLDLGPDVESGLAALESLLAGTFP